MLRINRRAVVLLAAVALVLAALVAPTGSTAKGSVPFKIVAKMHFVTGQSKSAGQGTVTIGKKTYKSVAAKGAVSPPKMVTTWAVPGGSITTVINNGKITNGVLGGTFSLKGTGKWKNISGSGRLSCPVAKLVFTFSGSASF